MKLFRISFKTKGEVAMMQQAGAVVGQTIELLGKYTKPGITSGELDIIAEEFILSKGCTPAFKGLYGFPRSICISFNEEIVHGIPGDRVLKEGDIITYDVGATLKGWNGDGAATFAVGEITPQAQKLLDVTRKSMYMGIDKMRAGNHLYEIGAEIQEYVEKNGFNVVRQYVGHGIGRRVHEEPQVPNYAQGKPGMVLRKGMCLAIEPMVNVGTYDTVMLEDQWTVVTKDGALSCHFEHSAAITDGDPLILTLP